MAWVVKSVRIINLSFFLTLRKLKSEFVIQISGNKKQMTERKWCHRSRLGKIKTHNKIYKQCISLVWGSAQMLSLVTVRVLTLGTWRIYYKNENTQVSRQISKEIAHISAVIKMILTIWYVDHLSGISIRK